MDTSRSLVLLGATGFVGHALVPRLAADGHRLTLLSRNREQHRELAVLPNVRVLSANVHDRTALLRHLRGADAVLNLVGILNESGAQTFARVHVELTRNLVDACSEAGVGRMLQMSSLKAGEAVSGYLRSRGEAESVVKLSRLDWTIFQPSVIFGPGDGLVSRFLGLLKMAPLMPLARPGARMAPVYVDDVAEAIARCVGGKAACSRRTLQLYGPEVLDLKQIVCMIRDAAGLRRPVIGLPDALGRLQARVLGMLPGKPFSMDNFGSLRVDSVGERDGLAELGITPHRFSAELPRLLQGGGYQRHLDRLRRHDP